MTTETTTETTDTTTADGAGAPAAAGASAAEAAAGAAPEAGADPAKPDAAAAEGDKGGDKRADTTADEPVDWSKALAEGLPEGVEPDTALIEAIAPILAEHKIPLEAATALRDAYAARVAAQAQAAVEGWKGTTEGWRSEIEKDPEVGGKALEQTRSDAAFFLDTYGGKELRSELDLYGFGNNPRLVKALAKGGAALRAASIESGVDGGKAGDRLAAMYPTMFKGQ